MGKRKTKEQFIEESIKVHGNNYNYSEVEYKNAHTKVKIFCNKCKKYFWQTPQAHLNRQGCSYCNGTHLRTEQEFIYEAQQLGNNKQKYNYKKVKYLGTKKKVKIFCNKCKKYFWQTPQKHLSGQGCPYCKNILIGEKVKSNNEEFIFKATKKYGDKYNYSKSKYIDVHTKLEIICNKCKRTFWKTPNAHLSGQGCPYCSKSKGEDKIQYLLEEYDINYEFQKRFIDCRDKNPLPFDFYLPELNVCIEYQGEQHYRSGFSFFKCKYKDKAEEAYRTLKLHDKIKKKYCKEHNIKLLEIKYCDNIEKKLNSIIKGVK